MQKKLKEKNAAKKKIPFAIEDGKSPQKLFHIFRMGKKSFYGETKFATFGLQRRKGEGGEEVINQIPNICDRSPLPPPPVLPLKVSIVKGVPGLPAKKAHPPTSPRLNPFFDRTIKAFVPTH